MGNPREKREEEHLGRAVYIVCTMRNVKDLEM